MQHRFAGLRKREREVKVVLLLIFFLILFHHLFLPHSPPNSTFTASHKNDHKTPHTPQPTPSSFLPPAQLEFPSNHEKPFRYQMHNCLRGRDGSKFGLKDAGIVWHPIQKFPEIAEFHRVFDDSVIMLACNNEKPSTTVSRDSRVNGHMLVSTTMGIVSDYCLGSIKKDQLLCRRKFALQFGCDYDSLGIQPKQYLLNNKQDCDAILNRAQREESRPWLLKPSVSLRGRGIKFFKNSQELVEEINHCATEPLESDVIVQEYVVKPALLGKFKFDVRTWMLIASVDPLILFYHEGFVRVARTPYEEESDNPFAHITNLEGQEGERRGEDHVETYLRSFAETSAQLTQEWNFPENFMQTGFKKQINRAQRFAALAQFVPEKNSPLNRKGFYHLFACDSAVDQNQVVHLLECNGFPAESQQMLVEKRTGPNVKDPQRMWKEMISLVLNLHLEPWRLLANQKGNSTLYQRKGLWENVPLIQGETFSVADNYRFASWELAFNELETEFDTVDVCDDKM